MKAVPVQQAAKALGIGETTLRRWLRAGAPRARRGRSGRGHSTLVCVEAVQAWRKAPARVHELLSEADLNADRRGSGRGETRADLGAFSEAERVRRRYLLALADDLPEILADALHESFLLIEGPHKRLCAGAFAGAWFMATSAVLDRLRADDPHVPELVLVPLKVSMLRTVFERFAKVESSSTDARLEDEKKWIP